MQANSSAQFVMYIVFFVLVGCKKESFHIKETTYYHAEVNISAAVYLPMGEGPFPAVVLVPSAEPDTKESYADYAAFFAEKGIAAVCYDKRGAGQSSGDINKADFDDLLGDALAGIDYLKTLAEIDSNQIGLMGHSQGGMYIFKADHIRNDIAFIIDFSGSPGTPLAQSHYNIKSKIEGKGGSPAYAEQLADLMDRYILYLHDREGYVEIQSAHDQLKAHPERHFADEIHYFEQFNYLQAPTELPPFEEMAMYPFMRSCNYRAAEYIPSLRAPALFIYGGNDKVIPAMACADTVKNFQRTKHNIDLKIYPTANHGIKENTAKGQRYPDGYMQGIVDWIIEHADDTADVIQNSRN
jgi:dienelactone hydrolase